MNFFWFILKSVNEVGLSGEYQYQKQLIQAAFQVIEQEQIIS